MMSLWDALRMNMMISYQELVRTFPNGFTEDDQYHLASVLEYRSSEGHLVIVSNSDTSLIRSLYRNFTHHYIKAKRSIGVSAGESKSATEIIAVSEARCWVGFDPSRGVDSSAVYGVRA
ncbi:DNA adenine methylase [Enterobacter roggenkampii]|nr:DNA adenine methylase [Enterobacter roggenkampii]